MKLSQYINILKDLEKQGWGDLPLIFARDDEGNGFQKSINPPCLVMCKNINNWWLENEDVEFDLSDSDIPNCVCIN